MRLVLRCNTGQNALILSETVNHRSTHHVVYKRETGTVDSVYTEINIVGQSQINPLCFILINV